MKQKELYSREGFLNMEAVMKLPVPYIFIIGARGIGKTYGMLEYVINHGVKFLYIRRLQGQIDMITKPQFNPFKKLNDDMGYDIFPYPISKNNQGFYHTVIDAKTKKRVQEGEPVGITGALSTFSNARGFDASDVELIFYDEFVPEEVEAKMRGEADAFFNLIETVNRNRELLGMTACRVVCASNSTNAANAIFMALNLVSVSMKMQKNGENVRIIKDREVAIVIPHDSPISKAKADTALYKLTKGTSYSASAIDNKFVNNVPTSVRQMPLQEYKPLVAVGEICIYKHKSKRRYYVSEHVSGSPDYYGASEKELAIFRKRYPLLQSAVYREIIDYESYTCELLFDKYLDSLYT